MSRESSSTFPFRPLSYYGTKTKILGSGTYGKVYMYMSNETVAIKKCYHYEGLIDAPVIREIIALVQLSHPNVVTLKDVVIDTSGGKLFMVMDMAFYDLRHYLEMGSSRPCYKCTLTENSKYLAYQIINGVNYCLSKGIVNGDIKPSNILIFAEGVVKICDFGLARSVAFTGNGNYQNNYTLWYRPPEGLVGGICDSRSDVWALGCTLFELYSQNTDHRLQAFKGFSEVEMLYYMTSEFGKLEELWPDITKLPRWKTTLVSRRKSMFLNLASSDVRDMIGGMLQIDPSKRSRLSTLLALSYFDSVRTSDTPSKDLPSFEMHKEEELIKILDQKNIVIDAKQKTIHEDNNLLIMLGWIEEVISTFDLTPCILLLAQNIIERYMIKKRIYSPKLQLYGLVALTIASQIVNDPQPLISDMVYVSDDTYSPTQIKEAYEDLCTILEFDFLCTLPTHYLDVWVKPYSEKIKKLTYALLYYLMLDQTFYRHYTPKEFALGCLTISCIFEDAKREDIVGKTDANLEVKVKDFISRFVTSKFERDPCKDRDEEEWYDREKRFQTLEMGLWYGARTIQDAVISKNYTAS